MKKRWKRKGVKVIAAAADWQAPPRYRKMDGDAMQLWADRLRDARDRIEAEQRAAVKDQS